MTIESLKSEAPSGSAGPRMVKNTLFLFGQSAFVAVATLFIQGIIARHLGPKDYGIFNYACMLPNLFLILTHLGLRSVMVRAIAQGKGADSSYLGLMFGTRIFLSLVTLGILNAISFYLHPDPHLRWIVAVASLMLIFLTLSTFFRDIFQGVERLGYEALTLMAIRIFTIAGTLIAIWSGGRAMSMIAVYTAGTLFGVIIPFFALIRHGVRIQPNFSFSTSIKLLGTGIPFAATGLIAMLLAKINPFLLAQFAGFSAVGIYTAASQLIGSLQIIPDNISTSLYPTIARGYTDPSIKIESIIQRVFFFSLLISLPIAVGGAICSNSIIHLIYGREFYDSAPILRLALVAIPTEFILLPTVYVLGAIHRQSRVVITNSVGAAVNIGLNFLFIPIWGAWGSAAASVGASMTCCAGVLWFLSRVYRPFADGPRYLRLAFANLGMASVLIPIRNFSPLWVIPLGAFVYAILILGLRVMSLEQAKDFTRQALGRNKADLI